MGLAELWKQSPDQLRGKQISQVIAFAGSGKLRDSSEASTEFRKFLWLVPSEFLGRYVDECLGSAKFEDSGLALQDVVNEIGRRLGFKVEDGFYRGVSGRAGFDGIWRSEDGKSIVIEVKTTDAYRMNLDAVGGYRQSLIKDGVLEDTGSSILIVVGREDTGGLEAQIRGSQYAWEARLISIDSLIRLMRLKEELEEPNVLQKIRDILTPQEFTKVDGIIDIVFATAEDVRQDDTEDEDEAADEEGEERKPKFIPAAFHEACIKRIESHLAKTLLRRSRATYTTADGSVAVVCAVSRPHGREASPSYWYAFHPHQLAGLERATQSYVGFGCGSAEALLLIPLSDFKEWLDGMNTTEKPDRFYWHVSIFQDASRFVLHRKKGFDRIDLTRYVLPIH